MSTSISTDVAAEASGGLRRRSPNRRRRRVLVGAVVVGLASAGAALLATGSIVHSKGSGSGRAAGNADPSSLATVTRQSLSSQTQVSATLGYAGSYSVVNQAQGTITSFPAVGQVISQGQVLYQVSGSPVVLLYGSTPAYRALSEGMSGADVEQLNADLVTLGFASSSNLDPKSDYFGGETAYALKLLERALGIDQTGTLALGQAVFLPTAVRITAILATLGGPAQPGSPLLSATSTARQVTIALDASQQSEVRPGDHVTITLPNNQTTPGVISSVGTVATTPSSGSSGAGSGSGSSGSGSGSSGTPTIAVQVTPNDPAATGSWDQAPVNVTITTATVHDALVVPVDSLLALSSGGYAVEVVGPGGIRTLVDVSLGLFDDADGLVQVTGSGLSAGQRVVVPSL
jgi:uncharacterized protein YijF (DUF1287 family)